MTARTDARGLIAEAADIARELRAQTRSVANRLALDSVIAALRDADKDLAELKPERPRLAVIHDVIPLGEETPAG